MKEFTLTYNTTTILWLHLEDWHNAGLTPEETRDAIESVWNVNYCKQQHINNNWNAHLKSSGELAAQATAFDIEVKLNELLATKMAKSTKRKKVDTK